jgi:hypothetical protein
MVSGLSYSHAATHDLELVTHLVNWWDENTLRLEKLYGDGLAARNTNQIHDYVSERMEYEWTIISKEFMGYTSKVSVTCYNAR